MLRLLKSWLGSIQIEEGAKVVKSMSIMRMILFTLILFLMTFASAEEVIHQQTEPETPLQQQLCDLALEQTSCLINVITNSEILDEAHELNAISDELYHFINKQLPHYDNPQLVLMFIPNDTWGSSDYIDSIKGTVSAENIHTMLAMNLVYRANTSYMEQNQADILESMSIYDTAIIEDLNGVAFISCSYTADSPRFITAISLTQDGEPAICKTSILYHKQMDMYDMDLPYFTGMVWDNSAFDIIAIKPATP